MHFQISRIIVVTLLFVHPKSFIANKQLIHIHSYIAPDWFFVQIACIVPPGKHVAKTHLMLKVLSRYHTKTFIIHWTSFTLLSICVSTIYSFKVFKKCNSYSISHKTISRENCHFLSKFVKTTKVFVYLD